MFVCKTDLTAPSLPLPPQSKDAKQPGHSMSGLFISHVGVGFRLDMTAYTGRPVSNRVIPPQQILFPVGSLQVRIQEGEDLSPGAGDVSMADSFGACSLSNSRFILYVVFALMSKIYYHTTIEISSVLSKESSFCKPAQKKRGLPPAQSVQRNRTASERPLKGLTFGIFSTVSSFTICTKS